jgi:predicted transcriptional regulator
LAPKAKPAPGIIKVREVNVKTLERHQVRNAVRPLDHDDIIAGEKVGQAGIPHFQGWVAQTIAVNVL